MPPFLPTSLLCFCRSSKPRGYAATNRKPSLIPSLFLGRVPDPRSLFFPSSCPAVLGSGDRPCWQRGGTLTKLSHECMYQHRLKQCHEWEALRA